MVYGIVEVAVAGAGVGGEGERERERNAVPESRSSRARDVFLPWRHPSRESVSVVGLMSLAPNWFVLLVWLWLWLWFHCRNASKLSLLVLK